MLTPSNGQPKSALSGSGPLTRQAEDSIWSQHMQHVLALNPANHGCTVLIRRKGKTYRFKITGPLLIERTSR